MDISKRTAIVVGVLTGLLLLGVSAFAASIPTARPADAPAVVLDVRAETPLEVADPVETNTTTVATTTTTTVQPVSPNLPIPTDNPTTIQPTAPWTPEPTAPDEVPPVIDPPVQTTPTQQEPIMTTPPRT